MARTEHEYYYGDAERADEMLRAFNAVYGGAPPTQEDRDNITNNVGNNVNRKRKPPAELERVEQHPNQRPRTESLVPGGDSGSENDYTPAEDVRPEAVTEPAKKKRGTARKEVDQSEEEEQSGDNCRNGTETEDGITYMFGKPIEGTLLLPLTPYFENRMKSLKGYVQLTVFDPAWIEKDHRQVGKKKTKTLKELQDDDLTATYSGLVPPEELLMTYGAWTDAIDLFIKYLECEYNRPVAAKMFRRHKENVVRIKRSTKCWMVALRYCMKVRLVVMVVKKSGGKRVMIDAGVLHEDILREAKEEAENKGERRFQENPYVAGGGKEAIDPTTGQTKNEAKRAFAYQNGNGNNQNASFNSTGGSFKQANTGYQGRNFIANFNANRRIRGFWNAGQKSDATQVFAANNTNSGRGRGSWQTRGRGGSTTGGESTRTVAELDKQ
ncbi:uncharacterized protein MELLADRAFT_91202 [Melampsora larici-populina 98AG31]|uniref:Uncharacterized protein n=1 Tax=Melampsora larici-populina (strain 98AG31 / pathotype 3-4-7) TaxID=747676 RepID=F4RY66_MELLP|nr:uncharacterized protein MELLADRAFT_91202 [Melampsora larici-populina 98AG31]EGG02694.1 hypothetical protein MELLADRAFT_91202 [Melampsora larici-populina 98AG31]